MPKPTRRQRALFWALVTVALLVFTCVMTFAFYGASVKFGVPGL